MQYTLQLSKKDLTLRKARISPDFKSKSVLVSEPFEFVNLWLKRNKHNDAQFYWQQAKEFYEASLILPLTAAPLTNYYCFLNATKALLSVKNIIFEDWHGLKGGNLDKQIGLHNEKVILCMGGVFPKLCEYLEEPILHRQTYTLRQLLYNLVYIHRAYCLTYPKEENRELFIPLNRNYFVRDSIEKSISFISELDNSFANGHTFNKIQDNFNLSDSENYNIIEFSQKIFYRDSFNINKIIKEEPFVSFHKKLRKHTQYIAGNSKIWYLKRFDIDNSLKLGSLPIAMAAMHRLSEMSRYDPLRLSKTLESNCNWLLSEFIKHSPTQFIDEIASEITGFEFLIPRRSS